MKSAPTVVLVLSGSCPDRAIAIEQMLLAAAGRSGWGDRLEVRLAGLGAGAGRLSAAGIAALHTVGIDAADAVCPDLSRRPDLMAGVEVVVCDRGKAADTLLDREEAGEAEFVCLDDLHDPAPNEDDDDEPSISDDVREFDGVMDEVLRRVIAKSAAA